MGFCTECGKENIQEAVFCAFCGKELKYRSEIVSDTEPCNTQKQTPDFDIEEQEFLDTTLRVLRWERKALHICTKIFRITGIIFTVFCGFCTMNCIKYPEYSILTGRWLSYTVVAAIVLASSIVQQITENKVLKLCDSLYTDFSPTVKRNGDITSLILSLLFCSVGFAFFVMNFISVKSNNQLISKILKKQKKENLL